MKERIYKGVVSLPSFEIELNYDFELIMLNNSFFT